MVGQGFGDSGLSQKRLLIYFLSFKRRQNKTASNLAEDRARDLAEVTQPSSEVSSRSPPWGTEEAPNPKHDGGRGQGRILLVLGLQKEEESALA